MVVQGCAGGGADGLGRLMPWGGRLGMMSWWLWGMYFALRGTFWSYLFSIFFEDVGSGSLLNGVVSTGIHWTVLLRHQELYVTPRFVRLRQM